MALKGVGIHWIRDIGIGIGIGIFLLILNKIFNGIISIGIPYVALATAGQIGRVIIVVGCASLFEEILFRNFILDYLDEKLINSPYILANLLQALMFGGFHYFAYGSSLLASGGSIFTASLFGFMMGYVRKTTNSNISNICIHALFNAFILFYVFMFVA